MRLACVLCLVATAFGCGDDSGPGDDAGSDAARADAARDGGGGTDSGGDDGGGTDGGGTDSGGDDGGGTDGGDVDAGGFDAGPGRDAGPGGAATAFRVTSIELVDPHIYAEIVSCMDITSTANSLIDDAVTMDGDGDGYYDLSFVDLFRPLDVAEPMNAAELYLQSLCMMGTPDSCEPGVGEIPVLTTSTNMMAASATCFTADAATLNPMYTEPNSPTGPCFVTDPARVTLDIAGVPIVLQDGQVAARFTGSPPDRQVEGVIAGFLSTEDAMSTTFPMDILLIGGDSLYEHLADGRAAGSACASRPTFMTDDSDTLRGVAGFWFYLNFEAEEVDWTDPPPPPP